MTTPAQSSPDLSGLSFEEALVQLQDVVTALESGSLSLDETIAQHRHGAALATYCQRLLTEAELQISEASPVGSPADDDGLSEEPALT